MAKEDFEKSEQKSYVEVKLENLILNFAHFKLRESSELKKNFFASYKNFQTNSM